MADHGWSHDSSSSCPAAIGHLDGHTPTSSPCDGWSDISEPRQEGAGGPPCTTAPSGITSAALPNGNNVGLDMVSCPKASSVVTDANLVTPSPLGIPKPAAEEALSCQGDLHKGASPHQIQALGGEPLACTQWWSRDLLDAMRSERQALGKQVRNVRLSSSCTGRWAEGFGAEARSEEGMQSYHWPT